MIRILQTFLITLLMIVLGYGLFEIYGMVINIGKIQQCDLSLRYIELLLQDSCVLGKSFQENGYILIKTPFEKNYEFLSFENVTIIKCKDIYVIEKARLIPLKNLLDKYMTARNVTLNNCSLRVVNFPPSERLYFNVSFSRGSNPTITILS